MKTLSILALVAVMLASCGGTNLKTVNLEPVLIQEGDLPAGFTGAQVKDTLPPMFEHAAPPTKALYQGFQRAGNGAGGVSVLLYESDTDRDATYADSVKGMGDGTQPQTDVGERATILSSDSYSTLLADLVFVRCHAVVFVRFIGTKQPSDAAAYAKRLDQRLQPLVC